MTLSLSLAALALAFFGGFILADLTRGGKR